jgi:hypothetical protein
MLDNNSIENDDYETSDEQQPEPSQNRDRKWIRDLEKRAKDAERVRAEADEARRELAFLKAGIDLDSPQGKLFAKAYDGEFTVDAVRASATEYGVLETPKQQIPTEEFAAMNRIASAAAGGQVHDPVDHVAEISAAETPQQVIEILAKAGVSLDYSQPGSWKSLS